MAVSRSTSRGGIRILIENTACGSQTRNVVYREVRFFVLLDMYEATLELQSEIRFPA